MTGVRSMLLMLSMTITQQLIERIEAVAAKTKRSPATISGLVLNSGSALAGLKKGKTITVASWQRAMDLLDEMERA